MGCHPNIWMAYNLQAFCFDLHVYSTLRLGATGAPTYNPPETLANVPCLTHFCFHPGSHVITKCSEPDAFPPKHLILSLTFPFCASLGATEQPKCTVSKRMAILGLRRTAPGTPWSPSAHASSKKWAGLNRFERHQFKVV